ncbi:MAG: Gfo/Idh/MocA family oxidoreductase [Actinomycetota bacterium]
MSEKIRWGICGTGSIASQFATALRNVPDAELVAVASEDADRCAAFAGEHDVPVSHLGYDAMADDDEVDVVYVASTQQRHLRDVLLLLEGGRNVLCEKPFALSEAQGRTMIETARQGGLFLMEAMWSRFQPSYVRLMELIADGAIGVPQRVEADFGFRIPEDERSDHRLFDPHRGGGALLDLGVYPVHLAHLVLGPPTSVVAAGRLTEGGVDSWTNLLLTHEGDAASVLTSAITVNGSLTGRVTGTEGVITLDPFMHVTTRLTVSSGFESETFEFDDPSLHHQVPEVHRCLRDGLIESEVMPHADTLAMLATLDEARRQIGLSFPDE